MARSRKILTAGALGVAAFALIGAGATATFNTRTDSNQRITAGTANVVLTAPGTDCLYVSDNCHSVTMPNVGPVGSKFESQHRLITAHNVGNVAVDSSKFNMSETHNGGDASSNALLAQTNVCIQSTDYSGGPWTEGNGPLTAAIALGINQNGVHLLPGDTIVYSVDFYAGMSSTQCHAVHSDGPGNLARWNGYLGHDYQQPASLTDAAQGGVVTPTLTYAVTG